MTVDRLPCVGYTMLGEPQDWMQKCRWDTSLDSLYHVTQKARQATLARVRALTGEPRRCLSFPGPHSNKMGMGFALATAMFLGWISPRHGKWASHVITGRGISRCELVLRFS